MMVVSGGNRIPGAGGDCVKAGRFRIDGFMMAVEASMVDLYCFG